MEEIRRLDKRLFLRELARPGRIINQLVVLGLVITSLGSSLPAWCLLAAIIQAWTVHSAWKDSIRKRFISRENALRWKACEERLEAFEEVFQKLKREQAADLREMPNTIRRVGQSIYIALRKADVVAHEVQVTEERIKPAAWNASSTDPQSLALYQLADRNIAEYRAEFNAVMAGVHRAEAQSAVYITTLDSLRMRMLGYRLRDRKPEMPSMDLMEALAEAKLQLQAIDKALDELDLGQYPHQIAVVSPKSTITDDPTHLRQNT